MELIRSKLEWPRPFPHLVRDRLVSALQSSVNSGLATFVVGRAGTGKSIAVSDFASACPCRVAWYTVDESDTELEHFAGYLSETIGLRTSGTALLAERVVEHLLSEFFERLEVPNLVIIEDLHLVYDTTWFSPFLTRLLPMLPLNIHMLFTMRTLPPVPLWRMRSKQILTILDEDTLAFTETEARRLFASYGLCQTGSTSAMRLTRGRASRLDSLARFLSSDASTTGSSGPAEARICQTV